MSWFSKLIPSRIRTDSTTRRSIPEGVWSSCPACKSVLYGAELQRNCSVCTKCGHHLRINARERIEVFLDAEERLELGTEVQPSDFLRFRDKKRYRERLAEAQKKTGESDALIAMAGTVLGQPVVVAAFDFEFMGGSMGSVVGEKFVLAAEHALEQNCPLVCFSASGGARMQEAIVSLFQMAKTSAALADLKAARIPFISVLTDPTTGGVSASLAMLGDVNIAEPNALIGFAGPRVIEQTVGQVLPEGFQRSEFLLEHGFIDAIIPRPQMRERIASLLSILTASPAPQIVTPVLEDAPGQDEDEVTAPEHDESGVDEGGGAADEVKHRQAPNTDSESS